MVFQKSEHLNDVIGGGVGRWSPVAWNPFSSSVWLSLGVRGRHYILFSKMLGWFVYEPCGTNVLWRLTFEFKPLKNVLWFKTFETKKNRCLMDKLTIRHPLLGVSEESQITYAWCTEQNAQIPERNSAKTINWRSNGQKWHSFNWFTWCRL
jgi:hypothetical protein